MATVQEWKVPVLVHRCHPVVVLALQYLWMVLIPPLPLMVDQERETEVEKEIFPSQTRITIDTIPLTMMISWTHSNGIKRYVVLVLFSLSPILV